MHWGLMQHHILVSHTYWLGQAGGTWQFPRSIIVMHLPSMLALQSGWIARHVALCLFTVLQLLVNWHVKVQWQCAISKIPTIVLKGGA